METKKDIAPLAELFLLLPEHSRIVSGEARQIGVEGEDASLQRGIKILTFALAISLLYLLFVIIVELSYADSESPITLLTAAIPIIVIAIFRYFVNRRYQCKKKLETIGILLPGTVVEAKGDKAVTGKGIKTALRLRYEFTSLKGNRIEREEAQLRDDISELPAPGTPIAVIMQTKMVFGCSSNNIDIRVNNARWQIVRG